MYPYIKPTGEREELSETGFVGRRQAPISIQRNPPVPEPKQPLMAPQSHHRVTNQSKKGIGQLNMKQTKGIKEQETPLRWRPKFGSVPPNKIWPRPIVILSPIDSTVTNMIYDAISDEAGDENYLTSLMRMALTETERDVLNDIRMDEQKHCQLLKEVYYSITGIWPEILPNKKHFGNNLKQEYKKAVFNELKDTEFYRKLMFSVNNSEIRDILFEILTDEQAHALKFNYLLMVDL